MSGVSIADLEKFANAFNRHDADAIMSLMTEDCVFISSSGADPEGTRIEGADAVRKAFIAVWEAYPDAHWGDAQHLVAGENGVTSWRFTATAPDGGKVEVDGVDLLTFRDGKVLVKNTFRKNRS